MSSRRGSGVLDRFESLVQSVSAFNRARAWRKFHAPKNLAMALVAEAAELMEPMRWLTAAASWRYGRDPTTRTVLEHEMADVLIVLISLADYLEIDLLAAARTKLEINGRKYPQEQSRGRSDKYTVYVTPKT